MWQRFWWRLVRLGFYLLYNEMAWTYDAVSWFASLGQWRQWQQAALPFVSGKRILEIAHGPGHMLQELAEAGYDVTGLDLSPAMGRLAQGRLRKARQPVALVRGRVQALPFSANSFDTVLSTFPTSFITETTTLCEVYRVLRSGGRFVIVPEGHLTGKGALPRFVNWLYVITGQRHEPFNADEQPQRQAKASWDAFERAMEAGGFQLEVERRTLQRSSVTVLIATRL